VVVTARTESFPVRAVITEKAEVFTEGLDPPIFVLTHKLKFASHSLAVPHHEKSSNRVSG